MIRPLGEHEDHLQLVIAANVAQLQRGQCVVLLRRHTPKKITVYLLYVLLHNNVEFGIFVVYTDADNTTHTQYTTDQEAMARIY